MSISNGDIVRFDLECATGVGKVENLGKKGGTCDIVVLGSIQWHEGVPRHGYSYEVCDDYCFDVPVGKLEEISGEDWPPEAKEEYLQEISLRNHDFSNLKPEEKNKCLRYIDELVASDRFWGYWFKGYLTYGGSELYRLDWEESRRCLEKCLEMKGDPDAANSLGYIYYYGRCNNGVGEYDKAYSCFSIAALAGNHEAMYKTGDLFSKGLGVPKNDDIALSLYEEVYDETRIWTSRGTVSTKFADAALRMATTYERRGYSEEQIYAKYLEAEYAINARRKLNYYGDDVVLRSIENGIAKYRPEKNCMVAHDTDFEPIYCFGSDYLSGAVLHVTITREGARADIRLKVVDPSTHNPSGGKVLLTLPKLSFCNLVKSYSLSCNLLMPDSIGLKDGETKEFYCTDAYPMVCEIDFVLTDGTTLILESDDWTYRRPTKTDLAKPDMQPQIWYKMP